MGKIGLGLSLVCIAISSYFRAERRPIHNWIQYCGFSGRAVQKKTQNKRFVKIKAPNVKRLPIAKIR